MDPPPPYSRTLEVHNAIGQQQHPAVRWHPKITPFRLFVLLTTVILGTMKAIFTYKGESIISTTLEWITGVIITLLIFILGEWESKENYPKYLKWFYTPDCADLIWMARRVFSLSRPIYRSDESSAVVITPTSTTVPITGYRILVSGVVVTLGSVKAALAYLGHNTTANTMDWMLAVFATSVLYCIGLYESNPVHLAPNFFSRNHSSPLLTIVRHIGIIVASALAMYVCLRWVRFSLYSVKNGLGAFTPTISSGISLFIVLHSLNVFLLLATSLSLALSLFGCVAILALTIWAFRQEISQILHHPFRYQGFSQFHSRYVHPVSGAMLAVFHRQFRGARRTGKLFLWTLIHLFGIVVLIDILIFFIGILMLLSEQNKLEKGYSAGLASNLVMQLAIVFFTAVFLWILYNAFRSLITPFLVSTRLAV